MEGPQCVALHANGSSCSHPSPRRFLLFIAPLWVVPIRGEALLVSLLGLLVVPSQRDHGPRNHTYTTCTNKVIMKWMRE